MLWGTRFGSKPLPAFLVQIVETPEHRVIQPIDHRQSAAGFTPAHSLQSSAFREIVGSQLNNWMA